MLVEDGRGLVRIPRHPRFARRDPHRGRDKDFCAGGDLKLTMPLFTGARNPRRVGHKLVSESMLFRHAILRGLPLYKPVIVAVNGNALGGGTEMTNACDLRVAAEHAMFGTPEAKRGLLPAADPSAGCHGRSRMPRPWRSSSGRLVLCARGARHRLLNYVVPKAQLMAKARELPRVGRKRSTRGAENQGRCDPHERLPLDQALEIEDEVSVAVMMSKDAREGPRAFKEKRKPRFTGE